jgi:hypothetical protein
MTSVFVFGKKLALFCTHTKPFPKNKFIVIICFETTAMGFLINSQINQFVQKRPSLMPCEVKLEQNDLKRTQIVNAGKSKPTPCIDFFNQSDYSMFASKNLKA